MFFGLFAKAGDCRLTMLYAGYLFLPAAVAVCICRSLQTIIPSVVQQVASSQPVAVSSVTMATDDAFGLSRQFVGGECNLTGVLAGGWSGLGA